MALIKATVLRFRREPISHSTHPGAHKSAAVPSDLAGKKVTVLLPGRKATCGCGAEWEWAVPNEEIERLTGKAPIRQITVCSNQVEAD